jgi:hypothetical protein
MGWEPPPSESEDMTLRKKPDVVYTQGRIPLSVIQEEKHRPLKPMAADEDYLDLLAIKKLKSQMAQDKEKKDEEKNVKLVEDNYKITPQDKSNIKQGLFEG